MKIFEIIFSSRFPFFLSLFAVGSFANAVNFKLPCDSEVRSPNSFLRVTDTGDTKVNGKPWNSFKLSEFTVLNNDIKRDFDNKKESNCAVIVDRTADDISIRMGASATTLDSRAINSLAEFRIPKNVMPLAVGKTKIEENYGSLVIEFNEGIVKFRQVLTGEKTGYVEGEFYTDENLNAVLGFKYREQFMFRSQSISQNYTCEGQFF
jgi:hypothetical protein